MKTATQSAKELGLKPGRSGSWYGKIGAACITLFTRGRGIHNQVRYITIWTPSLKEGWRVAKLLVEQFGKEVQDLSVFCGLASFSFTGGVWRPYGLTSPRAPLP